MVEVIQHPVVQALAWALVHFVWQGAAIGLAAYLAFRLVRGSASWRYAIGVGALVAMLAAPVVTFLVLSIGAAAPGAAASGPVIVLGPSEPASLAIDFASGPNGATPSLSLRVAPQVLAFAVFLWLTGVAFFSVRLMGGWIVARRYARRAVQPAADEIQAVAQRLAARLGLRRAVGILQSGAVAVPVMIGWLTPTIVLPIAALAGLSPAQVEALIAHELAHVRRHDYLVNLLQAVAEALLFYHPAVWWLSRRVRAERELCCDDLALGVCDRLVYATALSELAAMTSPGVALAATDGNLVGRVRRILGQGDDAPVVRAGLMPVLALALVAGIVAPTALASAPDDRSTAATLDQALANLPAPAPQTPPPSATTSSGQAAAQTEQQRIEDIRRRYEELLKAVSQLDQKRIEEMKTQLEAQLQKAQEARQTLRQTRIEAAERALQDARRQLEAGLVSQQQVAAAAAAVEAARAGADAQQRASIELKLSQEQLDRAKAMFDKGLLSEQQIKEMELALKSAQAKMGGDVQAQVAAAMAEAQARLARSQDLVAKGLLSDKDFAALKAQLANVEQNVMSGKLVQEKVAQALAAREKSLTDAASASQLYALLAERQAAEARDQRVLVEKNRVVTIAANEPVKSGDVLRITISGEPGLPAVYSVTEDGTIRLPFLGAIKVVGLTTDQVREAVGRQLAAKKLGTASQVTVSAVRRK